VPPSWIVKLPRRGSFKSSLRKSPKKKTPSKKRNKEKVSGDEECNAAVCLGGSRVIEDSWDLILAGAARHGTVQAEMSD